MALNTCVYYNSFSIHSHICTRVKCNMLSRLNAFNWNRFRCRCKAFNFRKYSNKNERSIIKYFQFRMNEYVNLLLKWCLFFYIMLILFSYIFFYLRTTHSNRFDQMKLFNRRYPFERICAEDSFKNHAHSHLMRST